MVSNYLLNRISTFKGWKEQKGGFTRYMTMGIATLFLDMGLLILFVKYGNFPAFLAGPTAILIAFVARYFIARNWVWKQKASVKS
jgi:putative flippase GtrA